MREQQRGRERECKRKKVIGREREREEVRERKRGREI